jgi:hypothetical protein
MAVAVPVYASGAITQTHVVASATLATSAPVFTAPTITQNQVLTGTFAPAVPTYTAANLVVIASEKTFARPVATTSAGGWTTELDGTDLHNSIDEVVPDDADYIKSSNNPVDDIARVRMGLGASSVHQTAKLRYRLSSAGGAVQQTVRFYSGATLIAGPWTHTVSAPTTFEQEIAANVITNPNDLYFEVEAA